MNQLDFQSLPVAPDTVTIDAWGQPNPSRACPSQPAVQDRWIAAVAVATRSGEPLELLGFGFPDKGTLLESACFCAACLYGYGAAGGILEQVARESHDLGHPSVNMMRLWRRNVQYGLLRQMKDASNAPLWLRIGPPSALLPIEARGLAAACTIEPVHAERMLKLERPMPVYIVDGGEYRPLA